MNILHINKHNRGSLTIEAAVVLPLYIMALVALISLMEMIKAYQDVEVNLYKPARELALCSAFKDAIRTEGSLLEDVSLTVLADYYADSVMKDNLSNDNQAKDVIVNGENGISFLLSSVYFRGNDATSSGDIIDLVAEYEMEPLFNIFSVKPYKVFNRCRVHAWTGYDGGGNGGSDSSERIVYITENGQVYHLSRSCSHIALSISETDKNKVSDMRNLDGGKYTPCEMCGLLPAESNSLFITDQGDRYHTSLTCSGLKRSVKAVPISEVQGMAACSRCGGG